MIKILMTDTHELVKTDCPLIFKRFPMAGECITFSDSPDKAYMVTTVIHNLVEDESLNGITIYVEDVSGAIY